MHAESDTITAISTPPGEGGVGIVRLSGPEALQIAARCFRSSSNRSLDPPQRIFHGHILDDTGRALDEVLVHLMRAPRSYTREDVVEINCHGGPAPLRAVLEETLRHGARLARPGEFTLRAFLNGRIDLVQAEAVIDQIRARTRAGVLAANAAAAGVLSRRLHEMREQLAFCLSRLEAAVDFPEDDLGELVDQDLVAQLRGAQAGMRALLDTADAGRLYREGAACAIVGRPNVGKSSLFNALLRESRAIVSAVPGTTRDRLEEYISIEGIPVRLIDTAGLRATHDEIEQIGVQIAREALRNANLILFVVDSTSPEEAEDRALAEELAGLESPVVLAMNKTDLAPDTALPNTLDYAAVQRVSALTHAGIPELEARLGELLLGGVSLSADQAMLNRVHQKDSLRRASEALDRLLADLSLSPEFLALEVQLALQALGEITGETTPDDILETIFNSFCIGK